MKWMPTDNSWLCYGPPTPVEHWPGTLEVGGPQQNVASYWEPGPQTKDRTEWGSCYQIYQLNQTPPFL